jgi:hypothetical protein
MDVNNGYYSAFVLKFRKELLLTVIWTQFKSVTLQMVVYHQSVHNGIKTPETHDQKFFSTQSLR